MTRHTARPTVYKGTHMRSRLEAGFAAWLDRQGARWEYEPVAFADATNGQYLPDFLCHDVLWPCGATARTYFEVKPPDFVVDAFHGADSMRPFNRMESLVHGNDCDARFAVVTPVFAGMLGRDGYRLGLGWPAIVLMTNGDGKVTAGTFARAWGSGWTQGVTLCLPEYEGPWEDGYWRGDA